MPASGATEGPLQAVDEPLGLAGVGGPDGVQERRLHAVAVRQARQGARLRGEARAAEAGPRREEGPPDAPVQAHAVHDRLGIRARGRGEAGDLVGEGDLGRQEDVGGDLDGLRAGEVGEQDRGRQRRIDPPQGFHQGAAPAAPSSWPSTPMTMRSGARKSSHGRRPPA